MSHPFGALYAYRNKATGEYLSRGRPYRSKSAASKSVRGSVKGSLVLKNPDYPEKGGFWLRPTDEEVTAAVADLWELVTFDLVERKP